MNRYVYLTILTTFAVLNSTLTFAQYTYHCGGNLLRFHGTNAYVSAEDPIIFSGGQSITLAAWVRCEVKNPSNMGIIYRRFTAHQPNPTPVEWGIVINAQGQFMFKAQIDTSGGINEPGTLPELDSLSSGVVPDSGKFYHIAVTLDEHSFLCNFYINGSIAASKTMKGGLHWATDVGGDFINVSIGCHSLTSGGILYPDSYFNGYIDEVFMSPSVISKSELDAVADGKDISSANWFFYHFNEGTGNRTYNYPDIVYNNYGYGNTGYLYEDIAWVNNPCPPFPITFINPYPEMVKDNGTLYTDISKINLNNKVIGAATDGLSKILLVAKTAANVKVQFLIQGTDNGSLSSLDQSVTNQPYVNVFSNSEGYAVGVYTAPDGYGSSYPLGGRNLTVWAFSYDNPNDPSAYTLSSNNLELVTPPVVLVHGMWSSPFVWLDEGFVKALAHSGYSIIPNPNTPESIFLADYSKYGASTFDPSSTESYGRDAVKQVISDALQSYRKKRFVATQVDIVGHSLGGLMARSFSQQGTSTNVENYNQGYIHKLITLGTPHKGSPFGPALWEAQNDWLFIPLPDPLPPIPVKISFLMAAAGRPIGLVHKDFAIDSPAIHHLQQTLPFKAYAINGDYLGDTKTKTQTDAYIAMNALCFAIFGRSQDAIFASRCNNSSTLSNDLCVTLSSQTGYITKDTTFYGTAHLSLIPVVGNNSETNSPLIQNKVIELLLSNDASKFSAGFPAPSSFELDCNTPNHRIYNQETSTNIKNKSSLEARSSAKENQTVHIVSPIRGAMYNQNSKANITLQFTTSNGALPTHSIFMIPDIGWFVPENLSDYSVSFVLPPNASVGSKNIVLLVRDTNGILMGDTSHIVITADGILNSLSVNPEAIRLDSLLREKKLYVHGYFATAGSNVIDNNLTDESTGTTYSAGNGEIFSIDKNGVVIAKKPGIDTLFVTNNGISIKVPVIVDSNYLQAHKYPNTIQFTIPDQTVDNPPFALTATNSSGENITYTLISGPVSLVNGVVIINGKGTVYIKASSPGNAYFDSAVSVVASFVITDALPLTLVKFIGSLNDNNEVNLTWQTEQEINTSKFIIERSFDGNTFFSTGEVAASGNSSSIKNYAYIDESPLDGNNFYRLKMLDEDGKFTYSNIVSIKVNNISNTFKIFPNPAKGFVTITGKNLQEVKLFDASGRLQLNQKIVNQSVFTLSVKNLSKGIYVVELKDTVGNKETKKLIVY